MTKKDTNGDYPLVLNAFADYLIALKKLQSAMATFGFTTNNVEPFADLSEIIAANSHGGSLCSRAYKEVDVICPSGLKIQVKSLRISSSRPTDNGIDWNACTRRRDGSLIRADRLGIAVFVDFIPLVYIHFPIEERDTFPHLNLKGLWYSHVLKLMSQSDLARDHGVEVVPLNEFLPHQRQDG